MSPSCGQPQDTHAHIVLASTLCNELREHSCVCEKLQVLSGKKEIAKQHSINVHSLLL